MTAKQLLKAEKLCDAHGYSGMDFNDYMHGYSEGFNSFHQTRKSDPFFRGYYDGKAAAGVKEEIVGKENDNESGSE